MKKTTHEKNHQYSWWPKNRVCPKPLFCKVFLAHISTMAVVMTRGLSWCHAAAAGKKSCSGNDSNGGDEDTFHVFQFGLLRIINVHEYKKVSVYGLSIHGRFD